jgi:hypothetical protein
VRLEANGEVKPPLLQIPLQTQDLAFLFMRLHRTPHGVWDDASDKPTLTRSQARHQRRSVCPHPRPPCALALAPEDNAQDMTISFQRRQRPGGLEAVFAVRRVPVRCS